MESFAFMSSFTTLKPLDRNINDSIATTCSFSSAQIRWDIKFSLGYMGPFCRSITYQFSGVSVRLIKAEQV